MNLLGPTLVLYLLVGLGVAVALYLSDPPRPSGERWLRLATAVPFWPFYLPILLARPTSLPTAPEDDLARTLAVVERELDAAQATLEEWIGIPEEQQQRLEKLREAWAAQTERLREMDRLLARPEYAGVEDQPSPSTAPRVRQSLTARQQNLERLRQVRQQAEADLLASLAWVRELASRIHLARFTDASEARGEELLTALASIVETLTAPHGSPEQVYAIKKAE
ncbi:MAG TPA: hypothetical protein VMG10_22850 [Gemmataceae bacterium]|nr:hypothetical protein [Gemmataceae bacterium]